MVRKSLLSSPDKAVRLCWTKRGCDPPLKTASSLLCPLFLLCSPASLTHSSGHLCGHTQPVKVQPGWWHSRLRASVTDLRMDLYLQHRTRKQLVNPFSLRPLICSHLLQQPKKSWGIFSSLLPIDPALRKSALLSKHYWSLPLNDRLSHQCIKGLDELKFHFRQLVPVIFTLLSIVGNMHWRAATQRVDQHWAQRGEGGSRWDCLDYPKRVLTPVYHKQESVTSIPVVKNGL